MASVKRDVTSLTSSKFEPWSGVGTYGCGSVNRNRGNRPAAKKSRKVTPRAGFVTVSISRSPSRGAPVGFLCRTFRCDSSTKGQPTLGLCNHQSDRSDSPFGREANVRSSCEGYSEQRNTMGGSRAQRRAHHRGWNVHRSRLCWPLSRRRD